MCNFVFRAFSGTLCGFTPECQNRVQIKRATFDLEDLWRQSHERAGTERKLTRKYGFFGLLVLDEWLIERRRRPRRRHHGPHRAQRGVALHGRGEHAQKDGRERDIAARPCNNQRL